MVGPDDSAPSLPSTTWFWMKLFAIEAQAFNTIEPPILDVIDAQVRCPVLLRKKCVSTRPRIEHGYGPVRARHLGPEAMVLVAMNNGIDTGCCIDPFSYGVSISEGASGWPVWLTMSPQ